MAFAGVEKETWRRGPRRLGGQWAGLSSQCQKELANGFQGGPETNFNEKERRRERLMRERRASGEYYRGEVGKGETEMDRDLSTTDEGRPRLTNWDRRKFCDSEWQETSWESQRRVPPLIQEQRAVQQRLDEALRETRAQGEEKAAMDETGATYGVVERNNGYSPWESRRLVSLGRVEGRREGEVDAK